MRETQTRDPVLRVLGTLVEDKWWGLFINFLLIPVLVLVSVLLPPVSAHERIMAAGHTRIGPEGGAVEEDDGAQVTLLPQGVQSSVLIKIEAVPRVHFLEGSAGQDLIEAAQNLPEHLITKSPYYKINLRDELPRTQGEDLTILSIPIPNDSEPLETLGLYTWTGAEWKWLPSHVIREDDVIVARLPFVPPSAMVMQTRPTAPIVSAYLEEGDELAEESAAIVSELNPRGLYLKGDGALGGDEAALPRPDQFLVLPTISNWAENGVIRSDLLDNMIVSTDLRHQHISVIVDMVNRNGFSGVDIDYRGLSPDLKKEFIDFITELATALHSNGKLLTVRVPLPRQISEEAWETFGYDWRAIGLVADAVKVSPLLDQKNYVIDAQMGKMLKWAVGEVNRYKLQLVLTAYSKLEKDGEEELITYEEALQPLTTVDYQEIHDEVSPEAAGDTVLSTGDKVLLSLPRVRGLEGIHFYEPSQNYWYAFRSEQDEIQYIGLENATSIVHRLELISHYNMRGVAIEGMFNSLNDQRIPEVIRSYRDNVIPLVESDFSLTVEVQDSEGGGLFSSAASPDSTFEWTPPEEGMYNVIAYLNDGGQVVGSKEPQATMVVIPPTPTSTPTPLPSPTATPLPPTATPLPVTETPTSVPPTATPKPQPTQPPAPAAEAEEPAPQPEPQPQQAAAPAPANIVNTGFGYGVQAHMMDQNHEAIINAVKGMGFNWIKVQIEWKMHESAGRGQYSWQAIDSIVNNCSANGINLMLSVVKAPAWARNTHEEEGPPINYEDYWNFMGAMAARYKGKVKAYEIWNEQNLLREWSGEPLSAARYVELLKGAYQAVKAQDPGAVVISGALTPTGVNDGVWAIDDQLFLNQMYDAGLRSFSDAIGAHPSGFNMPPDADWQTYNDPTAGFRGPSDNHHPSWSFRATMEGYRNIMVARGDAEKTIWPTEFGWASSQSPVFGYEFAGDNTLQEQAEYTVQAYQMMKAWGWVGTAFLWNLNFKIVAPGSEQGQWGILNTDWSPLPVYNALAAMPK